MPVTELHGRTQIRDAYRADEVARPYVDQRFREPLGALLHDRQIKALTRIIRDQAPRRVLEIAPGPARLTVHVARLLGGGVIIDASAEMLAEARRRLGAMDARGWRIIQGDAFRLPFREAFDLVYSFRLIRHFGRADRAQLYADIGALLRPGGLLVFDAVNEVVSAPIRTRSAPGEHRHYDALFRRDALIDELGEAGFDVVRLEGVQRRYRLLYRLQVLGAPRSRPLTRLAMEVVDRFTGGEPLEWIVTCRRR